ncbi:MAG: outer membrane protein transport protein [Gammaproteobacteria bacterium]|nr:outer membrane protein transport protein [Gammaproteobacteria bacterium]
MRQSSIRTILLGAVTAAAAAVWLAPAAHAGGFQLNEASAESMARANAGFSSANKNASANYYNPALLTFIDSTQFIIGATDFRTRGEFSKISATDATGQPLTGGNGGNMGDHNSLGAGVTPILAFAVPLSENTVFGVAFEVPFGLTTTFDGDSVLRYQAQYTSINVVNINPNIAYKIGDHFSVGFGLDFARLSAKLTNQIDYGAVCYAQLGPIACNSLGLQPQSHDGHFQIEGDDWSYGWNVGLAWQRGATTVGLSYRSRLFFDLEGDAVFKNTPAVFQPSGAFEPTGGHADVNLPDAIDLSVSQQIGPSWRVSASARYTRWSIFHAVTIDYDNPAQPSSTLVFNYQNTWTLALGADWRINPHWTVHGGVSYDESPVTDQYRNARLPDADRRWIAAGVTWNINNSSSLAFGWAHLFIGDSVPMDQTGTFGDHVVGTWSENADLYSIQYQMRF